LRQLRTSPDGTVTQKQLAEALGTSPALISSWESGTAIPAENRLEAYGRFFATPRSVEGERARLVPADDLTAEEHRRAGLLVEELVRLREEVLHPGGSAERDTGALGGRFWFFPDRQAITILCTNLSARQLGYLPDGSLPKDAPPISAYSRRTHPNYIESLLNGDTDALTELVGHIRAENPTTELRWTTFDRIRDPDELTGHLVILGGGDIAFRPGIDHAETVDPLRWFIRRLELPVMTRVPEGGDEEFDTEFVVTVDEEGEPAYQGPREEVYRPRFVREESKPERPPVLVDGAPQLEYDVALVARKTNPLNLSARITICSGAFSRGTYGSARTFTDAKLRARNERYIEGQFADANDFWMLFQVPVFGGRTITPDLERPFHRLKSSS
jgi:transcriptional regulator with XRE-family HTH domain